MPDIVTIGEERASAIVRGRRYDFIHPREGRKETAQHILELSEKWKKAVLERDESALLDQPTIDELVADARVVVVAILPDMPEWVRQGLDLMEMIQLITAWGALYGDESTEPAEEGVV